MLRDAARPQAPYSPSLGYVTAENEVFSSFNEGNTDAVRPTPTLIVANRDLAASEHNGGADNLPTTVSNGVSSASMASEHNEDEEPELPG